MDRNKKTVTVLLSLDLLCLEFVPHQVRKLIGEHGTKEHLGYWSSKAFVESNLELFSKGLCAKIR